MFITRVLTGAVLTVILGAIVYFSHIPAVLNTLIAFLSVKEYRAFRVVRVNDLYPNHIDSFS